MPIETAIPIDVFSQDAFHQVDRRVTGIAFDIHNEFGRYLDERLYQREFTRRCRSAGFEVHPEMWIKVSFDNYTKVYYVDHMIDRGVIIETKAAEGLCPAHKGQTLTYLFLCGLHHAAMLNFGTPRVQHEFVSTRLTFAQRREFEFTALSWKSLCSRCDAMLDILHDLLLEWGAYLDPVLYRDALIHFLGGEARVCREVPVHSSEGPIGTQKMQMLDDEIAFLVTTSTHRPDIVQEHQKRFIRHTRLRAIQWINLNHSRIELRTIERQ